MTAFYKATQKIQNFDGRGPGYARTVRCCGQIKKVTLRPKSAQTTYLCLSSSHDLISVCQLFYSSLYLFFGYTPACRGRVAKKWGPKGACQSETRVKMLFMKHFTRRRRESRISMDEVQYMCTPVHSTCCATDGPRKVKKSLGRGKPQ